MRAVRAIVIKDKQLLVMHRNKFGRQYYTLIGGGIDLGETPEQSLRREVQEETGLVIANPRLVFIEEAGDPYGTQFHFLCDYVSGEPVLSPESDEMKINQLKANLYQPMWLPLDQFDDVEFLSHRLRRAIQASLSKGWPAEPVNINDIYSNI